MSSSPEPLPHPPATPLPQPPAPRVGEAPFGAPIERREPRPLELTPAWRTAYTVGWLCALLGMASVWKSSRTLGLSTWWLGPDADPQLLVVSLLPFVAPIALVVASMRNVRFLPHAGVVGGLVTLGVGLGDLGRFQGLATAELVIGGAALLVSIASFGGLYRVDRTPPGMADPAN